MDYFVLIIFLLVYIGMSFGTWPGLAIDRTGIALLGAIAMIEVRNISLQEAVNDIDFPSIAILFSFMIISAQFYFSGFYTYVAGRMEKWTITPRYFLLAVVLISGVLSAVLINDIVCLAMAPLLISACFRKGYNPVPFLIGLACASNIGSALTLVGNPQNMLIGQVLNIPFAQYTLHVLVPCVLGLFACWWMIQRHTGEEWYKIHQGTQQDNPSVNSWQSIKGVFVIIVLIAIFMLSDLPREHVSLVAAGCLLLSRQMASRMILGFIDWQLLVLFIGLFVVNQEFSRSEIVKSCALCLTSGPLDVSSPASIFVLSALLSNLISNVPAVMLLLPFTTTQLTGTLLALSSTLAGNMFIVGSIANIIVVTQAANFGIKISWKQHMALGLPISLVTLALAAAWLYIVA